MFISVILCLFVFLFFLSAGNDGKERSYGGLYAGKPSAKGYLNQKVWSGVFFYLLKKKKQYIMSLHENNLLNDLLKCQLFICVFVQIILSLSGASDLGQKVELR